MDEILQKTITDLQERVLLLEYIVGHLAKLAGIETEEPEGFKDAVVNEILPLLAKRSKTA